MDPLKRLFKQIKYVIITSVLPLTLKQLRSFLMKLSYTTFKTNDLKMRSLELWNLWELFLVRNIYVVTWKFIRGKYRYVCNDSKQLGLGQIVKSLSYKYTCR